MHCFKTEDCQPQLQAPILAGYRISPVYFELTRGRAIQPLLNWTLRKYDGKSISQGANLLAIKAERNSRSQVNSNSVFVWSLSRVYGHQHITIMSGDRGVNTAISLLLRESSSEGAVTFSWSHSESENEAGQKPVSSPDAHRVPLTQKQMLAARCSVVSLPKSTSGTDSKALQIQLNETQEKYLDHIFNACPCYVHMIWPLIMVIPSCC